MASDSLQPLRGMADLRSPEIFLWQFVERIGRRVLETYGFGEIRTPIMEATSLFIRGIGDATDIVQKEMYRFEDLGGRDVCLRPEGTAGVIRRVAASGQDLKAARFYYLGPMFRYEKPQAGRYRQFHQLGVEAIGVPNPAADVECIALQLQLLEEWGLSGCRLEINTLGDSEDRKSVRDGMQGYLNPMREKLCEECRKRFDCNVLRILDCGSESCREIVQSIPPLTDWMKEDSKAYLADLRELLRLLGIEAVLQPHLVRGLDYYQHTVWEIRHDALGAQDQICGGGRYRFAFDNKIVEGVGFAMGLERICLVLGAAGVESKSLEQPVHVVIVTQDPAAFRENLVLTQTLRHRGIPCGIDLRNRSFKKQLREAGQSGTQWAIIRGQQEMEEGAFLLKNMADGSQESLSMPDLMERLTKPPQ